MTGMILNMKICIDADGCPVVDITVCEAKKRNIKAVIICDTSHELSNDYAEVIKVDNGTDSVDFKLVNLIQQGDIAVTQDYGLAAMCLAKKAVPVNQYGIIYSDENIDGLLFSRYANKKARRAGRRIKGPAKRKPCDDEKYLVALRRILDNEY